MSAVRRTTRLLPLLVAVPLSGLLLAGCGGGQGEGEDAPMTVEVGKAFEWNGFSVADGWELTSTEVSRAQQDVDQPDLTMTVTNEGSTRFALFQVVFVKSGEAAAIINCASSELEKGESEDITCPGLGAVFPTDFDAVSVQKIERDDS